MSEPVRVPGGVAVRCSRLVRFHSSPSGEVHALRGVDATFTAGTVSAVVGPSGSGKSTLLEVLSLQQRPSGGEVHLAGVSTSGLGATALRRLRRLSVTWVPQRPTHGLFGHLTAAEHLAQVAALRGAEPQVGAGLERVGLGARAGARPGQLSGGEQQRLVVAMAVVGSPVVVVADEPTAELDDASAGLVLAELRRSADEGACVVLSTHDARATAACDVELLLRHGVLSSERRERTSAAAVLDSTGRLQLPPEVLGRFASGRALVEPLPDGSVLLRPVPGDEGDEDDGDDVGRVPR